MAGLLPFATPERSVEEQLASLPAEHRQAFEELKRIWSVEKPKHKDIAPNLDFDDYMILRFARAPPGDTKFNVKTAQKVMINYAKWSTKRSFHAMNIASVRRQLETGCLIIPGNVNRDGHQFLYMKPSLFNPGKDDLQELIQSLVYLLGCMTQNEKNATEGIAFMANMADWTMSNFGIKYAKTFFDTMQGRYPLRVRMFLIIDPPSWFHVIWKLIRPMMSNDFAAKVHVIKREELGAYVAGPEHVPDALGGPVNLDNQLQQFIAHRCKAEGFQ